MAMSNDIPMFSLIAHIIVDYCRLLSLVLSYHIQIDVTNLRNAMGFGVNPHEVRLDVPSPVGPGQ